MKKATSNAFGKKIYLLGTYSDRYIWLEHPSWDCGHYWGFGYLEQYTNHKQPSRAKDIESHTHWCSFHNEGKKFEQTTFDSDEYNRLKVLFNRFYFLRKKASEKSEINEKLIPIITDEICKILTP